MISKTNWLKDSFPLTWQLTRARWALLLVLFVVGTALDIGVEDAMQLIPSTEEAQRWIMQLGLGIWELIEGVLVFLLLSAAVARVRPPRCSEIVQKPFAEPYLKTFLAEYLRLLAQTLMWGLLLLLPGFFRYCQLIFVPLIALFSKSYRNGHQDALKFAESLSRGRLMRVVLALAITTALQLLLEFLPEMQPALHIMSLRILFELVGFIINIWTYALIFILFEDAIRIWNDNPENAQ